MEKSDQMNNKEVLREIHDRVKNHPYWISFDTFLFRDVRDDFEQMIKLLDGPMFSRDGRMVYSNPYSAVALHMCHGLREMMWRESDFEKGSKESSRLIMLLQNFLMIVHQYVDDCGTPCYFVQASGKKTFDSVIKAQYVGNGEEHGYCVVCEVKKEDRDKVIELYEYLKNKSPYNKEWFEKYIHNLKTGNTDYYKFV